MESNTSRPYNKLGKTTAAQHDNHALPDGGTAPADLTLFQHAVLAVIADEPRYGLGIKRELEATFYETVNHGRLYPNLDTLVELGLAEKRELDRRSNEYAATEAGVQTLDALTDWFDDRRPFYSNEMLPDGERRSSNDHKRLWRCPECCHEVDRHHAKLERPFCDYCEDQHSVLIEMVPLGPGRKRFYDEDGNAINPTLVTDGGVAPANSDMASSANPDSFAFGITAMDLDDVSVSTDNGRYICTVRGPDRGIVDGHSVIELANAHGHGVLDVYADVEAGELTIEVEL